MRIAVVAPLVAPLRPAQLGGSPALVTDLAVALAGRGHAVTLFCAEGSEVDGVELAPVSVADLHLRPLDMTRPGSASDPAAAAAFARLYDRLRAGVFDVVSQHAYDAEAFELAAGLSVPVLHTLHLPPLSDRVREAAARTPHRLATVSQACARDWQAAGVPVAMVLANGVPDLAPAGLPVRRAAMIGGRISPEKGTHVAVRVATELGLDAVIAGPVYDAAYAAEHALTTLGQLPRQKLRRLMEECAVTLMPVSWEEPFGLVAAESQLAGTPVAAYRRGALPEVISEGVGGFLAEPGNEAELIHAARRALALDRAAVHASATGRFSVEQMAAGYEAALSER